MKLPRSARPRILRAVRMGGLLFWSNKGMQSLYRWLADGTLVVHAAVVFFIIGALPVIWLGHYRRWAFVKSFGFRVTHLVLIGIVAAESVFGLICPLTTWEDTWRVKAGGEANYRGGFIANWLHRLIFYDAPPWVFIAAYVLFFGLVLLTWFLIRPLAPASRRSRAP